MEELQTLTKDNRRTKRKMKTTSNRAFGAGVGVLVAAYVFWYVLLQVKTFSLVAMTFLWLSPLIAALVASYLAPRRKVLLGALMAFPAAILAAVLNSVVEFFGHAVDLPGVTGGLITFALTLAVASVLAFIGGLAGHLLSRLRNENHARRL